MNDTTRLTKRYFSELINLFFTNESYFLLCVSKEMNTSSLFDKDHDDERMKLINLLILRLVESQNVVDTLDDLAEIKGFSTLSDRLENNLSQLDIIKARSDNAKQSIAQMAKFVVLELKTILDDQDSHIELNEYLADYKSGHGEGVDDNAGSLNTWKSNEQLVDKFFQDEVYRALSNIEKYENMKSWEFNKLEYLDDWKKCSQDIKSLSMMQGNNEVETIADRIYRVIGIHISSDTRPNRRTNKILNHGKHAIEHFMEKENGQEDIIEIIGSLDKYIHEVEKSLFSEDTAITEEKEEEVMPIVEEISKIAGPDPPEEIKLPGEDDPELLSLVGEIIKTQHNSEDEPDLYNISEKNHIQADEYVKDKKFIEESSLYIDLIKRALNDLTKNAYDFSALEDLELASSSLKGCALKFGYEELGKLPDTIENVAIILMSKKLPISAVIFPVIDDVVHFIRNFAEVDVAHERIQILLNKLNQYIDEILLKQDHSELSNS